MRLSDKKGAVLIMTMMALVLVFMMIHALMQTTGIGLHNTGTFYDREAALQAAQSGLDYAVTRMQTNRRWQGDANRSYWAGTRTFPQGSFGEGFVVAESYGNVVGLIRSKAGAISAFRIKFNPEDTSDATREKVPTLDFTDMGDSEESEITHKTTLPIAMTYLSFNNLTSSSKLKVYRSNESGEGIADSTDNLEYGEGNELQQRDFSCSLPAQRAMVIVEGLSGSGLRDCTTPNEVNKAANDKTKSLTRRYVEAYYSLNSEIIKGDVAYAGKDVNFSVANKMFVSGSCDDDSGDAEDNDLSTLPSPGSLRSNGDLKVEGGTLNTYNGKVYGPNVSASDFKNDGGKYTFKDSQGKNQTYSFTTTPAKSTAQAEDIDISDLAQAPAEDQNKLLAGYYEWHVTGKNKDNKTCYELRYYGAVSSSDNTKPASNSTYQVVQLDDGSGTELDASENVFMGPQGKIGFDLDEEGNISSPVLYLNGQLHCNGAITIASDLSNVKESCPAVNFGDYSRAPGETGGEVQTESGVLQSTGNITVLGAVKGTGAVVTPSGDVTICGESVFESGNNGVAIYANNVNLNPLTVALSESNGSELSNPESAPKVSGEGSSFYPGAKEICDVYNSNPGGSWNVISERRRKIENICKDKYKARVYIAESGVNSADEGFDWWLRLLFVNSDNRTYGAYSYEILCNPSTGTMSVRDVNHDSMVTSIPVPPESVITDGPPLRKPLKRVAQNCGDLCYGDQSFKGIIYARNDVNVQLGSQFKFLVTGAIRAQEGNITVRCKDSVLNYDESALDKLLPNRCTLSRVMWNCW